MTDWFVLKSRDELLTAGFLAEAGYLAYVPVEVVERRRAGKLEPHPRPAFRGYVFVHCSEQAFSAVRAIGNSDDFVRYTNMLGVRVPLRLPVNALLPIALAEACGEFDYVAQKAKGAYKPARGDHVRIRGGMWEGYLGTILSLNEKKAIVETKWCRLEVAPMELEAAA